MRRLLPILAVAVLASSLAAPPAQAEFGFSELDVTFLDANGSEAMQAGSHPFAVKTTINPNSEEIPGFGKAPSGQPRDVVVELPEGFIGSPDATPQCPMSQFLTPVFFAGGAARLPECPDISAIGVVTARGALDGPEIELATPVYNLEPPPGKAARFGFQVQTVGAVTVDLSLRESPPYNVIATSRNITQMRDFYGADLEFWSDPGDSLHDDDRGICGGSLEVSGEGLPPDLGDFLGITCPVGDTPPPVPLLTLPRSCTGPVSTFFHAASWQNPGDFLASGLPDLTDPDWVTGEVISHDLSEPPQPRGFGGCEELDFGPTISSAPTSQSASSPSGLDFGLDIENEGLLDPDGISDSDIESAIVALPEGMTINPSQAEGLATCSEADLARESAASEFGAGCPAASKIGSVEVESPLLEGVLLKGSVFVATPHENPFDTLIALYMTIKEPQRGIYVSLAGEVEPDPETGQITAFFDDLPQVPFSHFRFHFREGGRSPLVTPPLCGTYETEALFTPSANPEEALLTTAPFEITRGPGGGPCPPGGKPPFEPGFDAGSASNQAGAHTTFSLLLTRRDGDQDLTKFSTTLPKGLLAKLAGVSQCSAAQIARARAKSGKAELASPSCPANSQIGTATGGAGVGSQLTYVPGKIYLAGPYRGAPISVVGIVPAVAGPFDVGTIVTQFALQIDPRTAQVRVDGDKSDPIPHILAGIPLVVREIEGVINRPNFALNPTSCDPTQVAADIWGGGLDLFSVLDDSPVTRSVRFQAAGCRGLGFAPKLDLKLKGGTKRGDHPKLRGVFEPRDDDANLEQLVLRLPRSAFLDQAHIRTICTRVQFAANNCPKAAIYGQVRAFTPLLAEPLEGPAYLRSSDNNLPDLVFDLHSSLVDFEAVARIDSKRGGIRATFSELPDAPIDKVIVNMQGGRKGLIVNSQNLCDKKHRANARLRAHSGKERTIKPVMRAECRKSARSGKRRG
jgi:hypothetical protein